MATGIKDKVAILGMGCSKFGERWESGAEELMVEAYLEGIQDAGIDVNQIQAAWFSTAMRTLPPLHCSEPLQPSMSSCPSAD